ncbi:MAG: hypothetical protein PVG35_14605 [Desulfobacterales bacterium]
MDLRRRRLIVLFCICIMPQTALSGDFDGIKPLSGSVDKVIEINTLKIINDVDRDTVGLPRHFFIDFKAKKLRPSKDSLVRKPATSIVLRM